MSLTRVDCDFFRGGSAELETSSYVAFNPGQLPGGLVMGASLAAKSSIGSQVACKLCLEHFVEGILDCFDDESQKSSKIALANAVEESTSFDLCQKLLEAAFKRANTSVYNFGHKLAAGGRMAASLMGIVIEERKIATGRVGNWSVFLLRDGELFPFFEEKESLSNSSALDGYVGAKSLVTIETATVPVEAGDLVFAFSTKLGDQETDRLIKITDQFASFQPGCCQEIVEQLFSDPQQIVFSTLIRIGPDAIYLSEVVGD